MTAQTILPANTLSSGYDVDNSLRFNGGSSDYLNRTNATPTNQFIWTFSFWVKLSDITNSQGDGNQMLLSDYGSSSNRGAIFFESDDTLRIADRVSNSFTFEYRTTRLFRDPSAWYHIVVNHNRTLSTPVTKVYVNGVQETSFSTSTNPSQNGTSYFNVDGQASYVGKYGGGNEYYNGYISEAVWIDGQALDADSFGEFDEDSGIWKPIDGLADDLTFGDNGFYLEFKQSGTGTNASGMGADTSGNTNHFAVNNLTAIDQTTDTCTNNFAVINPEDVGARVNLSEGNLKFIGETSTGAEQWGRTTFGVSKGKWYWEMTKIANNPAIGIVTMQSPLNEVIENNTAARGLIYTGGQIDGQDNSGQVNALATSIADYGDNDIVSCMMDLDNGFIYFAKNGTIQIGADDSTTGNPASGSSGTGAANPTSQLLTNQHDGVWSPLIFDNSSNPAATAIYNFGNPTVAPSSGNADGNGHGNFEYAPPSGYLALCTKNLATTG